MSKGEHTPDLSQSEAKNAALTLSLKANSGYRSTETHRVSSSQWADILAICTNGERRAVIAAAPELLTVAEAVDACARGGADTVSFLIELSRIAKLAAAAIAKTRAAS